MLVFLRENWFDYVSFFKLINHVSVFCTQIFLLYSSCIVFILHLIENSVLPVTFCIASVFPYNSSFPSKASFIFSLHFHSFLFSLMANALRFLFLLSDQIVFSFIFPFLFQPRACRRFPTIFLYIFLQFTLLQFLYFFTFGFDFYGRENFLRFYESNYGCFQLILNLPQNKSHFSQVSNNFRREKQSDFVKLVFWKMPKLSIIYIRFSLNIFSDLALYGFTNTPNLI